MSSKVIKTLAIAFALAVCTAAAWPQHGQPGVSPNIPGGGQPGHTPAGTVVAASVYDDATAVWAFNDPADLGAAVPDTYDLTLVNTPTATGGALGYAAQMNGSSQYAYRDDGGDLNHGGSTTLGFCAWYKSDVAAPSTTQRPFAKYDTGAGAGYAEWLGYYTAATTFTFLAYGSTGTQTSASVTGVDPDVRNLYCFWYNASDKKAYASLNGAAPSSGSAIPDTFDDGPSKLSFGSQGNPSNYISGSFGPIWYYKGGVPPYSELYNSGKGYTCAAAVTAGLNTNLVSCWDMTESGGPYADSIGSNTLTGVNTPTRAAGLVERSDSGISVNVVSSSSQYLTVADNAGLSIGATDSFTVTGWTFLKDQTGSENIFGKGAGAQNAGNTEYLLDVTSDEQFRVWISDGTNLSTAQPTSGSKSALIGTWVFFAMRLDNAADLLKIRVNDGADVTKAWTYGSQDAAANFSIGRNGAYNAYYYNSAVDNVAFWRRALTDAELDGLYAAGAGDFYAAYWDAYFSGDPIRFAWSAMPEIRRID